MVSHRDGGLLVLDPTDVAQAPGQPARSSISGRRFSQVCSVSRRARAAAAIDSRRSRSARRSDTTSRASAGVAKDATFRPGVKHSANADTVDVDHRHATGDDLKQLVRQPLLIVAAGDRERQLPPRVHRRLAGVVDPFTPPADAEGRHPIV